LEADDLAGARAELPELERVVGEASLNPLAERAARRGLGELADGLADDAYWRQRTWKLVSVIFAGPGANILLAIALPFVAYLIGAPGHVTRTVETVKSGTPATAIGLQPGDTIIAVDGRPTPDFDTVSHEIRGSKGKAITVTVDRRGRMKTLGPIETKKMEGHYALGFSPRFDKVSYGPGGALVHALDDTWNGTKGIITFLPRLFTGAGRKQVSSPVGIVGY